MSIPVTCGQCGAKFQAPDNSRGKRGKCPKCAAAICVGDPLPAIRQQQLTAPGPSRLPAIVSQAPAMPIQARPVSPPAVPEAHRKTANCAFCGEEILAVAVKCKHCGETLDPAMRKAEEAHRLAETALNRPSAAAAAPVTVMTHVHNHTSMQLNQVNAIGPSGPQKSLVCGLASLFIPGLGQLLRGRMLAAVLWFFIGGALDVATFGIAVPFVHIACAARAYNG